MQVAEHPALGALREALHARRWPTLTEERGAPTHKLSCANAMPHCFIAESSRGGATSVS